MYGGYEVVNNKNVKTNEPFNYEESAFVQKCSMKNNVPKRNEA